MNTPNNPDDSSQSTEAESSDLNSEDSSSEPTGCGAWAPAIIAGGSLLLIVFFISCAGGTYWLYQQRGDLVMRTIEGTLIPLVEQSRIAPQEKQATIEELQALVVRGKSGQLEDWQMAGAMQRLVRAPLLSWGDLQYIRSQIESASGFSDIEKADAVRDISRLMRASELDKVTQIEMATMFAPISNKANHETGYQLNETFTDDQLRQFIKLVRSVAKRAEVPEKDYNVKLDVVVRRHIEAGIESGMK